MERNVWTCVMWERERKKEEQDTESNLTMMSQWLSQHWEGGSSKIVLPSFMVLKGLPPTL